MVKVGDRIQVNGTGGFEYLAPDSKGTVIKVESLSKCLRATMDGYTYGAEGVHGTDLKEDSIAHNFFNEEYTIIEETTEDERSKI